MTTKTNNSNQGQASDVSAAAIILASETLSAVITTTPAERLSHMISIRNEANNLLSEIAGADESLNIYIPLLYKKYNVQAFSIDELQKTQHELDSLLQIDPGANEYAYRLVEWSSAVGWLLQQEIKIHQLTEACEIYKDGLSNNTDRMKIDELLTIIQDPSIDRCTTLDRFSHGRDLYKLYTEVTEITDGCFLNAQMKAVEEYQHYLNTLYYSSTNQDEKDKIFNMMLTPSKLITMLSDPKKTTQEKLDEYKLSSLYIPNAEKSIADANALLTDYQFHTQQTLTLSSQFHTEKLSAITALLTITSNPQKENALIQSYRLNEAFDEDKKKLFQQDAIGERFASVISQIKSFLGLGDGMTASERFKIRLQSMKAKMNIDQSPDEELSNRMAPQ